MTLRVFITGMGLTAPFGNSVSRARTWLQNGASHIRPLHGFPSNTILPAGEVDGLTVDPVIPRTHCLALSVVNQALKNNTGPVDAVVAGTTTGGMDHTETFLRDNICEPSRYQFHGAGSIARMVADKISCSGPVITISTACSSGTAALKIALELIRSGTARTVLALGTDALCRFTYFGFHSLQLIDPDGARPFDRDRKGMNVAEGAAALLLEAGRTAPENALAELCGAGLSCDAYHPTTPHPEGRGAKEAMEQALQDAGLSPADIDYINLHGTGTLDNDRSEARAVGSLFGPSPPPRSSIKGAMGHPLAAAGAIEAVVAVLSIRDSMIPANTGCQNPDPEVGLEPVCEPTPRILDTILSNSFGFGGNNAAAVISSLNGPGNPLPGRPIPQLEVIRAECLTGAGKTRATLERFLAGCPCTGTLPLPAIAENLPPRRIRRLKRLPQMALALADAVCTGNEKDQMPGSVFWGTGWGPLSETNDFLIQLFETHEKFCSPTDFIGSVHNAAAGQVALHLNITGPNLTTTDDDYSFEQALLTASLLTPKESDQPLLVMGADEYHPRLSRLFDPSVARVHTASDGGGALLVRKQTDSNHVRIALPFFQKADPGPGPVDMLVQALGGPDRINQNFGMLLVGIPAACRETGESQIQRFVSETAFNGRVIDFRKRIGEYATATATAVGLSAALLSKTADTDSIDLHGRGILLVGTGSYLTAIALTRHDG